MNDFPDLVPPPERPLTGVQRDRLRAKLPGADQDRERRWLAPAIAAAAVVAVVGVGFALSRSVDGTNSGSKYVAPAGGGPSANALPFEPNADFCMLGAPRTDVLYSQVTPLRDVVLTSAQLENPTLATFGGAWVTPKPVGSVAISGAFEEGLRGMSGTVRRQWDDRRPLVGARLEKGRTYTFFVRFTIRRHGHFDGLRFNDREGSVPGTTFVGGLVEAPDKCA